MSSCDLFKHGSTCGSIQHALGCCSERYSIAAAARNRKLQIRNMWLEGRVWMSGFEPRGCTSTDGFRRWSKFQWPVFGVSSAQTIIAAVTNCKYRIRTLVFELNTAAQEVQLTALSDRGQKSCMERFDAKYAFESLKNAWLPTDSCK